MSHIDILWLEQLATETSNFDGLVMVDFWAERCGPCRMLAPVLHQIADQSAGKVKLLKVDVDAEENQPLSIKYGISSIPRVFFFAHGAPVGDFVGVQSVDAVTALVEKYMPAGDVQKTQEATSIGD